MLNAAGRSVSEEEARRVRRTDWFKDAQAQLNAETIDRVNAETEAVETIHHAAKRVPACGNIESEARVESRFDTFLNQLDLPVEFSAQYQYDETNGNILIDLDLPEIEDLPQKKAAALASGAVRVKPKTLAEKRETYQKCVFGIAILFADGCVPFKCGRSECTGIRLYAAAETRARAKWRINTCSRSRSIARRLRMRALSARIRQRLCRRSAIA